MARPKMRTLTPSLVTGAVLLLALTGCPGSDATNSATNASGGSSSTACSDYYEAFAARTARCDSREMSATSRARFEQLCEKTLTAPGVVDGGAALARCADEMRSLDCDKEPECEVVPGELADGAPCHGDAQCKSTECVKAPSATCGVCATRTPIGGSCETVDCARGARCVLVSGTEMKCVAIKIAKAGEPCQQSGEETADCDEGLRCVYDDSASKATCEPFGDEGTACGESADCGDGLRCIRAKCAAPLPEGDPCIVVANECGDGLGCDGTCKPIVKAKVGEACDDVTRRCASGTCLGASVTVVENVPDIKPGTCVERIEEGAACKESGSGGGRTSSAVCDDFTACIAGTCTVPDPSECE